MQKLVLLGDEAIAQGAIDAGITGIYAYPGTPSTEITEYVMNAEEAKLGNIKAVWCANEKTAMETAIGVSYVGKRAMVCMKHVGLNVAADAFINSAMTGANGGLVVVTADDPSMHSSQNEQDSRFYGKFAMMPILEPYNQQEAYDMVQYGFDLSEKLEIPVLIRITTRLAHSRAGIIRNDDIRDQNEIVLPSDPFQYILVPGSARIRYKLLLEKLPQYMVASETSCYNIYYDAPDKSLGIITAGIAYNYLMENFPDRVIPHPVLKIGQYPLPKNMVERIYDECDTILLLEEGAPFIEEMLKGYLDKGKMIKGRLDGAIPRKGELTPNIVAAALGMSVNTGFPIPENVKPRPPSLCKGCPHIYSYNALNEAMEEYTKGRAFSDIGCYSLGVFEPYKAINSLVDMGASIPMAKGAADAGLIPSVAVIGDSTFIHSGITGLVDAVNAKSPITILILDNLTTAMTGMQDSLATGRIESICEGVGVEKEHIRILYPISKEHEVNMKVMKEELVYEGVSVIIPRRECLHVVAKRIRAEKKVKQKMEEL